MTRTLLFLGSRVAFTACLTFAGSPLALGTDSLLTRISDVRALGAEKANELRLPVKLRGVVTYVLAKGTEFKLQDGTGGIGVKIGDNQAKPVEGEEVEVEGYTNQLSVQAWAYPHVHGSRIQPLGMKAFPIAARVTVGEIADFNQYDQWVSVEGVVVMWMLNSSKLTLLIASDDEWVEVHVRNVKEADLPPALHGAHVRVTGVNMGSSHSREDAMIAPTSAQLEILNQGTSDIFKAPLRTVEDVVKGAVPVAERVLIRGVLLAKVEGNVVYVRDGDRALRASIQGAWIHSSEPGFLYGDAGSMPAMKPGDEVELVGAVRHPRIVTDRGSQFYDCHIRVVGEGEAPEPVEVTLSQIQAGAHTSNLVQLKARLVSREQFPDDYGFWRTQLNLETGGVQVSAYSKTKQQEVFGEIRADDEVQLSGVVEATPQGIEHMIRIVSPTDVVSLGIAPAMRERQFWIWSGSLAGVVLFLGMWISTLSRALSRQRNSDAALRDLNMTLESRVEERTTQLEASQRELERTLHQEKELGELKTRFVTMVSHEFRTPLGITMSAVELMRHYDDKLPTEQRRELCDDIYSATKNMAALMEQVLVLGRVEAGKVGYRPAPLDLGLLAAKLTDESLSATDRKCTILWRPQGDLTGATADESLLRHILGNLITNAVKYSPVGSEVIFTGRRDGGEAVFEVIDQGIGIPEEDRDQLFEAFHRCSNVGDVPGTGLGLVIVKRCVDLHGGSIEVRSKINMGTTFTVRVPVVPAGSLTAVA